MKRVLLITGMIVLASSMAWATPTCVSDSLANYILLGAGGCQIGDKIFSNFDYTGTPNAPTAANINVKPRTPSAFVDGVLFTGSWTVSGVNQSLDSNITFTVTVPGGNQVIEDASFITLSGVGITGTGLLTVTEGLCLGSSPCPGGTKALFDATTGPGAFVLQDHTIFTPTGSVDAAKDINLTTGNPTGLVTFSSIADDFSQVPEPASIALLGSSLLAFCIVARRKRAA